MPTPPPSTDWTSCWGGILAGPSRCTPGFTAGRNHFQTKFCDQCRDNGIKVPAACIRVELPTSNLPVTNGPAIGFWNVAFDFQGRYRIINQTAKCAPPTYVLMEDPNSGIASSDFLEPMPARYVDAEGHVLIIVCKGTLVPAEPRHIARMPRKRSASHREAAQRRHASQAAGAPSASHRPAAGAPPAAARPLVTSRSSCDTPPSPEEAAAEATAGSATELEPLPASAPCGAPSAVEGRGSANGLELLLEALDATGRASIKMQNGAQQDAASRGTAAGSGGAQHGTQRYAEQRYAEQRYDEGAQCNSQCHGDPHDADCRACKSAKTEDVRQDTRYADRYADRYRHRDRYAAAEADAPSADAPPTAAHGGHWESMTVDGAAHDAPAAAPPAFTAPAAGWTAAALPTATPPAAAPQRTSAPHNGVVAAPPPPNAAPTVAWTMGTAARAGLTGGAAASVAPRWAPDVLSSALCAAVAPGAVLPPNSWTSSMPSTTPCFAPPPVIGGGEGDARGAAAVADAPAAALPIQMRGGPPPLHLASSSPLVSHVAAAAATAQLLPALPGGVAAPAGAPYWSIDDASSWPKLRAQPQPLQRPLQRPLHQPLHQPLQQPLQQPKLRVCWTSDEDATILRAVETLGR